MFLWTGMSDLTDSFGDLDDSAMDVEGPTTLMYRYSRRKSDSKSDENSQNSKCEFCHTKRYVTKAIILF